MNKEIKQFLTRVEKSVESSPEISLFDLNQALANEKVIRLGLCTNDVDGTILSTLKIKRLKGLIEFKKSSEELRELKREKQNNQDHEWQLQ